MTPEESLLAYLYPHLAEAIQTWKDFDDIYGIWLFVGLSEDNRSQTELMDVLVLRESVAYERERSYGSRWAPGFLSRPNEEIRFRPFLCSAPWPPDDEDHAHLLTLEGIFNPGDPEGCALRNTYFDWKRTEQGDGNFDELTWFIEICGKLIGKLHDTGAITQACSKPVPIGISFNNDLDKALPLAAVQANNPPSFTEGMLAWMRSG